MSPGQPSPGSVVGVRSGGHVTFQSTLGQLLLLGTYVGFSGTSTVVNALSRKDGEYEYVVVSLTLVTEVVKLFVASSIFYWKHYNKRKAAYWISIVRKSAPYAVPAAVYVFDNNLVFGVLYFLRPSEVALLSNISVITTALLFRFILHRMISKVQWCALVTLMLALMISRVGEKSSLSAFNWGHLLLFFQVICSSFGNIYTEKVLKRASRSLGSTAADAPPAWTPLSLQNTILYSYGVLFNFFSLLAVGAYQGRLKSLFGGWNTVCLAVVFTNATAGLLVSLVLKKLDNMKKVLSSGCTMILTVVLSHFAFGKEPHLNFYFAMALIINAIVLYNLPAAAPSTALVPPATAVTLPTSHRERSSIQEGDALAAQSSLLETEAESE